MALIQHHALHRPMLLQLLDSESQGSGTCRNPACKILQQFGNSSEMSRKMCRSATGDNAGRQDNVLSEGTYAADAPTQGLEAM